MIRASNEIDGVSKFDNYLSFGAKQNAPWQIFFELWSFKDFFTNNSKTTFFDFFKFSEGSIKEYIDACLSMKIQENKYMRIAEQSPASGNDKQ